MGKWNSPNLSQAEDFECLGHSNLAICAIDISQIWKMDFSQPECGAGFLVPGAFKVDHLHPAKSILLPEFSNFFSFIQGANSYYPREGMAENGKMEFTKAECGAGF